MVDGGSLKEQGLTRMVGRKPTIEQYQDKLINASSNKLSPDLLEDNWQRGKLKRLFKEEKNRLKRQSAKRESEGQGRSRDFNVYYIGNDAMKEALGSNCLEEGKYFGSFYLVTDNSVYSFTSIGDKGYHVCKFGREKGFKRNEVEILGTGRIQNELVLGRSFNINIKSGLSAGNIG